jgi:hypothetical protein
MLHLTTVLSLCLVVQEFELRPHACWAPILALQPLCQPLTVVLNNGSEKMPQCLGMLLFKQHTAELL